MINTTTFQNEEQDCLDLCEDDQNCTAVSLNSQGNECELYTTDNCETFEIILTHNVYTGMYIKVI